MTRERAGMSRRISMMLTGLGMLALANASSAQTLGAVEQRLDRLEKVTKELQRATDRHTAAPAARDDALLRIDRRLTAMERAVSSLLSGQEGDRRELAGVVAQLQRMKTDVESRLDAVESRPVAAAAAPVAPSIMSAPAAMDADGLFRQAMAYAEARDWLKAELAFDTFVSSYPSDARVPEARFQLGRAFQGQGKSAQAAQIFLSLYEAHPGASFAVANLFALGEALSAISPNDNGQACDVYGEIDAGHGPSLTVEQRAQLLDRRIALKCAN